MLKTATLLLLALGGCTKDPTFPGSIPDSTYPNGHALSLNEVDRDDTTWEEGLFTLTNDKRVELGLNPLSRSLTLDAIARAHSLHMEQHYFFDHLNPEGDLGSDRLRKFTKAPFVLCENIWIVEPGRTPQYVLDGFMASAAHRDNILSAGQLMGVGIVRRPYNSVPNHIYVTMVFVELR